MQSILNAYRDLSERGSCEAEVSKLAFVAGVF